MRASRAAKLQAEVESSSASPMETVETSAASGSAAMETDEAAEPAACSPEAEIYLLALCASMLCQWKRLEACAALTIATVARLKYFFCVPRPLERRARARGKSARILWVFSSRGTRARERPNTIYISTRASKRALSLVCASVVCTLGGSTRVGRWTR